MITDTEENTVSIINVLQAMKMVDKTWRNVTPHAVRNCFKTCGFPLEPQESIEEDGDKTPEEWEKVMSGLEVTFDEFVTCDNGVATADILREEEIVGAVMHGAKSEEVEEDLNDEPQDQPKLISISEAKTAVNALRSFIEHCSNIDDDTVN